MFTDELYSDEMNMTSFNNRRCLLLETLTRLLNSTYYEEQSPKVRLFVHLTRSMWVVEEVVV